VHSLDQHPPHASGTSDYSDFHGTISQLKVNPLIFSIIRIDRVLSRA
jgi:hypothetical protein